MEKLEDKDNKEKPARIVNDYPQGNVIANGVHREESTKAQKDARDEHRKKLKPEVPE